MLIGCAVLIGTGCKNEGDKNQINPALLLLSGPSTNVLTLNVTYTGPYDTDATKPGTKFVYAYLYKTLGANTRSPVPDYTTSTAAAVTDATAQTLTFSNIASGAYYILVFYDYAGGGNADNQKDRYILYNNVSCNASATPVTVSGPASLTISFGNTYSLLATAAFVCP